MSHRLRSAAGLLILLVAACGEREPTTPTPTSPAAPAGARSSGVDYQAALAASGRPAADREQDAWRKPAESLAFFAVQPGMEALDLFAG